MPAAICPRCQTPIFPQTAYIRIYARDESDHESYTRVHFQCPKSPVDERPNLAAAPPGAGATAMQGGGIDSRNPALAMFPRFLIALAAGIAAQRAARRAKSGR